MNQPHLATCPFCARRVRPSEPACTLCERELDEAFRLAPTARALAVRRLSRAALFAIGAAGLVVACGSNGARQGVTNDPDASACPTSTLPSCPLAGDASSCAAGCGLDSVPQGLACSGTSQCSMLVQPTPGCSRTDGYVCSCVDGRWSCDDCWLGTATCEVGSDAAASPDAPTSTDSGANEAGPRDGSPLDDSSEDVTSNTDASACPASTLPSCPLAGDASSCAAGCGLDSLPQGLACSGTSQCSMLVQPTPGCSRTDGYVCSCVDGRWSCDDCWLGTATCEGG
jgi:hypothetical protein